MNSMNDKLKIYFDILSLMKNDGISIEYRPTIQKKLGLRYDRLIIYIEELMKLGMLSNIRDKIVITEKGQEFLFNYSKLLDLMSG